MLTPLPERSRPAPPTPPEQACRAVLDRARRDLTEPQFKLWFSGLAPGEMRGEVVELLAPTPYVKSWLSGHYMDLLIAAVREALGPGARVRLRANKTAPEPSDGAATPETAAAPGASAATKASAATQAHPAARGRRSARPEPHPDQISLDGALASPFPGRYTFDTFVRGPSNKFAHAAALAVAESPPSTAYNPLFIYGGTGLGKTHLLFAVAGYVFALSPRSRIRYATSEHFMTEFIRAIREGRGYHFQKQYRDVDFLLLDDVQFFARAEETQTEFFHTFNHLHQNGRQIVIASDRPPQDLGGIEERLRSRFRSGLVVDIQPPDLETRVAILQLKAQRDELVAPDDVLLFIASRFDQNIRELEGALHRVVAFASLSHEPLTVGLAERALHDLIQQAGREPHPAIILEETAAYFGIPIEDLASKSRSRPLTTARHVAMYLLREQTGLSLIKIADLFDRDHTTALHGIKKIEALMAERGTLFRQVQDLTRGIRRRTGES